MARCRTSTGRALGVVAARQENPQETEEKQDHDDHDHDRQRQVDIAEDQPCQREAVAALTRLPDLAACHVSGQDRDHAGDEGVREDVARNSGDEADDGHGVRRPRHQSARGDGRCRGHAAGLESWVLHLFPACQFAPVRPPSAGTRQVRGANEVEALVLECNLIKHYRPRFNIRLRDDKNYLYLKLPVTEEFPRVHYTRRIHDDGSLYYGPYTSAQSLRSTVKSLRQLLP